MKAPKLPPSIDAKHPLTRAEKRALRKVGKEEWSDGPWTCGMAWSNVDRIMTSNQFLRVTGAGLMVESERHGWILTPKGKIEAAGA